MTWTQGQPVLTASDHAEWQAWRKARILECQRRRRSEHRRIDYYVSEDALAVIARRTFPSVGGDYSSIIDTLVIAGARKLPEFRDTSRRRARANKLGDA
jgi:hypothetical protein